MRSLDNFDDPNGHLWECGVGEVLPVEWLPFEGMFIAVPSNYRRFLKEAYGDIYELPKDIDSHFDHVGKATLDDERVICALEAILRQG